MTTLIGHPRGLAPGDRMLVHRVPEIAPICCLALLWVAAHPMAGADEIEPSAPPPVKSLQLFDGKSLDGWKVTEFGAEGEVRVDNGRLILGFGDGCTGVTWTGEFPKSNFEVELEAMRVDGVDFFCGMTFPVGQEHASLIVGGWGGTTVGLSCINGADASENETTRDMSFDKGRWYKVRLQVNDDRIQAWIDDRQVVNVPRKDREFSLRPEVVLSKPFGLTSWQTTAAIRNLHLRRLEAKSHVPSR